MENVALISDDIFASWNHSIALPLVWREVSFLSIFWYVLASPLIMIEVQNNVHAFDLATFLSLYFINCLLFVYESPFSEIVWLIKVIIYPRTVNLHYSEFNIFKPCNYESALLFVSSLNECLVFDWAIQYFPDIVLKLLKPQAFTLLDIIDWYSKTFETLSFSK